MYDLDIKPTVDKIFKKTRKKESEAIRKYSQEDSGDLKPP
jgi:hypothetical protein